MMVQFISGIAVGGAATFCAFLVAGFVRIRRKRRVSNSIVSVNESVVAIVQPIKGGKKRVYSS